MVEDGLDMYLLEADLKLYAAVLLTTGFGIVVRDRYFLTISDCRHAARFYTFLLEVFLHGVCALLRELEVHFGFADIIGVACTSMI